MVKPDFLNFKIAHLLWESSNRGPHSPKGVILRIDELRRVQIEAYDLLGGQFTLEVNDVIGVVEGQVYSNAIEQGSTKVLFRPEYIMRDSLYGNGLPGDAGTIEFTKIENDVYEGKFEFTLYGKIPTDIIEVREGRFRVNR